MRAPLLPRAAATLLAVAAALLACPAAFAADPALERARALFDGSAIHARGAQAADPHAATLVLRDLHAALPRLTRAERAEAELLLARPTNEYAPEDPGWGSGYSERLCDSHFCVHWVENGPDAPRLADGDASGAPDWVETTLAVFEQSWATEIGELGYRAPRSDLDSFENGGDERLDIYLANVGADALFGWCTSDDPTWHRVTSRLSVLRNRRGLRQRRLRARAAAGAQGDRRARVLPRDAVRLRLARGSLAHGGNRGVDRGRGLRRRQRQPPLPAQAQPVRAGGPPGRPRPRRARVRRLDLLALSLRAARHRTS